MSKIKGFSLRMEKDLWLFLKKISAEQEISTTQVILNCVRSMRKKYEKKEWEKSLTL